MSILDENNEQPSRAKFVADRLIDITRRTFGEMTVAFNEGAFLFWDNAGSASPEEIALELGTNASEIFYLHARLGELIASVKPELISDALSVVGEFTMNEDGSVTVIPPPTTTVEPIPPAPGIDTSTTVDPSV